MPPRSLVYIFSVGARGYIYQTLGMNFLRFCLLVLCLGAQITLADTASEADRLKQVTEEIKARRALRSMNATDRAQLLFVREENGVRFVAKDRLLMECHEGLASLYGKEIVMTQLVASKKIAILTGTLSTEGARDQMTRTLEEAEITAIELGDTSLLLVAKSQLPKTLRAPVR